MDFKARNPAGCTLPTGFIRVSLGEYPGLIFFKKNKKNLKKGVDITPNWVYNVLKKNGEVKKMKVISSQRYINWDIVAEKMAELEGETKIEIVMWETGLQDLDGEDVYVMGDKHHTRLAAIKLGIEIEYVIDEHPEGLTGEDLLEQSWIDSDWRYIDTDIPVWQ